MPFTRCRFNRRAIHGAPTSEGVRALSDAACDASGCPFVICYSVLSHALGPRAKRPHFRHMVNPKKPTLEVEPPIGV